MSHSIMVTLAAFLTALGLLSCERVGFGAPARSIRVHVVNAEGNPIANAKVASRKLDARDRWVPKSGGIKLSRWRWDVCPQRTDAAGSVLIEELEPGVYQVAAGQQNRWCYEYSEQVMPHGSVSLTLTPFPSEQVVSGAVFTPDGLPASRAAVSYIWNDRGERVEQRTMADEFGSFQLFVHDANANGTLFASTRKQEFRSAALESVSPGATKHAIKLGEPRELIVEVQSESGEILEHASAGFAWHVAGERLAPFAGRLSQRKNRLSWELPDVPYYVTASAPGHESTSFGPFDSNETGSRLVVQLARTQHVRGRVMCKGEPASDTWVWMQAETANWSPNVRTDQNGRFEFKLEAKNTFTFKAWSDELGGGSLEPLEIDPSNPPQDIEIEITRAPGAIEGKVLFPPGHEWHEIWLTTSRNGGLMRVSEDGSFLLPGLPEGPIDIQVRESGSSAGASSPVSTTIHSNGTWVFMSHGPTRAPTWLPIEQAYTATIISGETVHADVDLNRKPVCTLNGRVRIDKKPPIPTDLGRPYMWFPPIYQVELNSLETGNYVSRTEFAEDGSFTLLASEPGMYEMRLTLNVPGSRMPFQAGDSWQLTEQVELKRGSNDWKFDEPTGALTVLPSESNGAVKAFRGELRFSGPGSRKIFTGAYPEPNGPERSVQFRWVPCGKVEVLSDYRSQRVLLETEVHAGETTTVTLPRD